MPELTIRPPRMRAGPPTPLEKQQIQQLNRQQRIAGMINGHFSYAQLCWWASRWPHEVPLVNGEYAFLALFEAETAETTARIRVSDEIAALARAA